MIDKTILLVQCCDLPQFFFIVKKLRAQHPGWRFEFMVADHQRIRSYLSHFGCSDAQIPAGQKSDFSKYDAVLFPLLNRGYLRIKKRAWAIPTRKMQVDYSGQLREVRLLELMGSLLRANSRPGREFQEFAGQFPYPELGAKVLVVGRSDPSLSQKATDRLNSLLSDDSETYQIAEGSLIRQWKKSRGRKFDGALIHWTPGKISLGLRILPFILRVKRILIIDEDGHPYSNTFRGLARLSLRHLRFGVAFSDKAFRILFLQTEDCHCTAECLARLKTNALFPNARVLLICRDEDRHILSEVEGVEETVCWSKDNRLAQIQTIRRQIRRYQPEINCAIFTGRPIFRIQKLACFLLGSSRRLAFNGNLDAYWLSPATILRVLKKEPFRPSKQPTRVLLLETSEDSKMRAALRTVQEPDVVPNAQVTVFCREDKLSQFEGFPAITYSKDSIRNNLRAVGRLFRARPDVLAAVFSGPRIYQKHRLLFWLIPAHSRLAFNQHLDCFYVDRRNFHQILGETSGTPTSALRLGLRGILFFPRFVYLVAWWTGWKTGIIRKG